ncbi:hypothetical protein AOQ84DRAFT_332744 [Glonium stellatum]|uniref:HD domain-containing protein n=1 Tax=Glonium stellatum TaxID=574774 RepID=A0A8E2FBE6_9PEZI|nr:hypothetical protein AOQ84DRAFT_332744 [Glonium stellatum]
MAQTTPALPTRVIAGITVPDTPLIAKALAYARSLMDDQGYNHIVRSWLTGMAIVSHLPTSATGSLDLEAFSVANILHDLGWAITGDVVSTDKRFEVDGANGARAFIQREVEGTQEWDAHRLQLVWDAIALHTTPSIARFKQPEVAFTSLGIFAELTGPAIAPPGTLSQAEFDSIAAEFPRADLKGYIRETMCRLCRTKPDTTYDNFVGEYGERFLEGFSLKGKLAIDALDGGIV